MPSSRTPSQRRDGCAAKVEPMDAFPTRKLASRLLALTAPRPGVVRMAALIAQRQAPIGRPVTLRYEIERLDATIAQADGRLRRADIAVLEALREKIDFATGTLFPSCETLAD